ncbi:MAG: 4Fe-4S dicluster domain-containing protein [Bacteroidales bacterium]|nr:4Fe-4S dicluster domain-containing protein [Bacteroidales bacterium]
MVDFGFGLVPSSRINLDLFDKEKYDELLSIEPDARICMACGSCTAVCTAGKFVHTSLREAMEDIFNAKPDKALETLRACQLCGKCSMVCPRGINTRHLIMSITKVYSKK